MKKIRLEWYDDLEKLKREEFTIPDSLALDNIKDIIDVTITQDIDETNINMFETNLSSVVKSERLHIIEIDFAIGFSSDSVFDMSSEQLSEIKESLKVLNNKNNAFRNVIVYLNDLPIKIENISENLLKSVINLSFNSDSVKEENLTQEERVVEILKEVGVKVSTYEAPVFTFNFNKTKNTNATVTLNEVIANVKHQAEHDKKDKEEVSQKNL